MREIIFDTETTGFDPRNGDRLVEIGCVELIDRRETGVTFPAYFHPERDMPAAAEAVHGLSIHFLSDKPARKGVVAGKGGSGRVDTGGRRIHKKKKNIN